MSRYHTDREVEALATLADQFGYPLAGTMIRNGVRALAIMEPQVITDDPEGSGEILARLVERGESLVWIGPPPPPDAGPAAPAE